MKTHLISLPRIQKQLFAIAVDVASILLSVWVAYSLRLETFHMPVNDEQLMYVIPLFIAIPIFIRLGLYRAIFRYVGQHAMWTILKAVAIYGVLFFGFSLHKKSSSVNNKKLYFLVLVCIRNLRVSMIRSFIF